MVSKKDQILSESIDILVNAGPEGKKYKEMMALLVTKFPQTPENTIHGNVWKLHKVADEIKKVDRGHFVHKSFLDFDDMENEEVILSQFLNRNDYNIMINFLEEFKDEFEEVQIKELSKLDDESLKRFNTLLKMSTLI
jgi:hypothetical protein